MPDPPSRWEALGFAVTASCVLLPGVKVVLGSTEFAVGIEGVSELQGLALTEGIPTAPVYTNHPNGAVAIDHVVAITPDFDRTAAALEKSGLGLKLVRDTGRSRQGFRRLGPVILELVEVPDAPKPAWWGLTVTVPELDTLPSELIAKPKVAVQPGRFIATVRSPGTPLAFMTPEPG